MVHSHTWHVLNIVLQHSDEADDKVAVVLASLFHDIGNKKCKFRKVTESEIARSDNKEQLGRERYAQRIEHMYWGAMRAYDILNELGFKEQVVLHVVMMVLRHDLRKVIDGFKTDCKDLKLLCRADAEWMLTEDGITRDIARSIEQGLEPMTRGGQLEWNRKVVANQSV